MAISVASCIISIHAPREGSDTASPGLLARTWRFLSTLPVRGATLSKTRTQSGLAPISIHAPREGSDLRPPPETVKRIDFYPRSP